MKRFTFSKPQKPASHESGLLVSEEPKEAPQTAPAHDIPEIRLITNCNALPLLVFIACICHADFGGLIESGEPTPAQIREAWEVILAQYADLSATEAGQAEIAQSASRQAQWNRLDRINSLLGIAVVVGEESLVAVLEEEGYGLDMTASEEQLKEQLKILSIRLKSEALRLRIEGKKEGQQEAEERGPLSEDFFYEALVSVSEVLGLHLQADKLTTAEFCRYFRRLCNEIDRRNRMIQKQKGHGTD